MTTLLVKNVPESLEKELHKLKAEFGCRTWAELLARLVESNGRRGLEEDRVGEMKRGVEEFLQLRTRVSKNWRGRPSVIEESRKSRRHDG